MHVCLDYAACERDAAGVFEVFVPFEAADGEGDGLPVAGVAEDDGDFAGVVVGGYGGGAEERFGGVAADAEDGRRGPDRPPFRSARTSDSRNLRWPPGVLVEPSFPASAQRLTVFGSTRNSAPTSAGVSSRSNVTGVLSLFMLVLSRFRVVRVVRARPLRWRGPRPCTG